MNYDNSMYKLYASVFAEVTNKIRYSNVGKY